MKKIITIGMIFIMSALCLVGCGGQDTKKAEEPSKKIKIVATIFPQYDFTKAIVGDKADVKMLLKPGAESHTYEPTPQDMKAIQASNLFIYTGGENDSWIDGMLKNFGKKKPITLKLTKVIKPVEEKLVEGMEEEHEHDEDEDHDHDHDKDSKHDEDEVEFDEHVWTSPQNAIKIVEAITAEVSKLDPSNKDTYEANAKEYISKLETLDKEFKDVVAKAKRKVFVFGDRFPLRYFADAYGLKYYAAFPGCAAQNECSAATIAFLTDKVKKEKLPIVFKIELSKGNIAKSIADATGAKVMTFYSCHNVGSDKLGKTSYLKMMEENVKALKIALNK